MNVKKLIASAIITYAAFVTTASASITYDLTLQIPYATIAGTITTDGTTGVLNSSNILDFNISLTTEGSGAATIIGPGPDGSVSVGVAPGLTATLTGLFWDFSSTGSSYLRFSGDGGFLCYNGAAGDCSGHDYALAVSAGELHVAFTRGILQIARADVAPAVPEPSTWAMMILGFAGIGAMTYRRRKTAALAA